MKRINYIFLCLALALGSCNNKNQSDFDILSYKNSSINFSSIVDTLSYKFIPLETSDSTIIGRVLKVEIADDIVFVLDESTGSVNKFDLDGRFIGKIGTKGRGPGEYLEANNFVLNRKEKQILVSDKRSYNILFYDYSGNFRHSCRMGSNPFAYLRESKDFVFLRSPMDTPEKYELRRFKYCTEDQVTGYIPRPNYIEKQAYTIIKNYFVQQGDCYYFVPLYTDELHRLTENGIELVYKFGFQEDMFNHDIAELTTDVYKSGKLSEITKFYLNNKGSYMFKVGYGIETEFDVVGNINTKRIEAGGQMKEIIPVSILFALNTVGVYNEYFISSIPYGHLFQSYFSNRTEEDNPILLLYKVKIDSE